MSEPRAPHPHDEPHRLTLHRENAAVTLDRVMHESPAVSRAGVVADLAAVVDHFDRRIREAGRPDPAMIQVTAKVVELGQLADVVDELLAAVEDAGLTADFFTGRYGALTGPLNRLSALRS